MDHSLIGLDFPRNLSTRNTIPRALFFDKMLNSLKGLSELVATTFFVLATITIVLRIYSRAWVVMSFGWDDWCMVSILVRHDLQVCFDGTDAI